MEDKDIIEARKKSAKAQEKKQSNESTKNRSDRVSWEEIKPSKSNIIRQGIIVNIIHDEVESFLTDAYYLLNIRMKNALKNHNDFKISIGLCIELNSTNKDFKLDDMHIDVNTDIESWYNSSVEESLINKLKQLKANNRGLELKVTCLWVCFSESDSVPEKLNHSTPSTSACSNIENIVKKTESVSNTKPLLVCRDNNIPQIRNSRASTADNNTVSDIVFYHQNMQSIGNKVDKLESLAHSRQLDFLLLTEHWIAGDREKPKIDGYDWVSIYKRQSGIRGGAAILVSEQIRGTITSYDNVNEMSEETTIEIAACLWHERNLMILTLYRPPNGSIPKFLTILEQVLENVISKNKFDIIIGGDFNIDFSLKEDSATKRLIKLLSTYNLRIMIEDNTRVRLRTKKCIDNIITNLEDVTARVVDADISDHFGQEMRLQCKNKKNNVKWPKYIGG